ncbi:glycerophosphodiester phosphodiesterase family protein [Ameyamaea chiangmaiensis]|nr:glycerophosphodiester phosphodiesterase family protein [Ameyamaea chiangmaiensis]
MATAAVALSPIVLSPRPARALSLPAARPLICAHRGWTDPTQAENSLIQMRQTLRHGPFMMELDLATDSDGTIVLMHDDTVNRTTDGDGPVAAMTDAQRQRLRLRRADGATDEAIPLYDDVLRWAASAPTARLMLDIKGVSPEAALTPVRRAGLSDRVVVLTFHPAQSQAAFDADPDALVCVLTADAAQLTAARDMARGRRFAAYVPRAADVALFHAAHQAGAVVITDLLGPGAFGATHDIWMPDAAARWVRSRPIDIIVTNTPVSLRAALSHSTG